MFSLLALLFQNYFMEQSMPTRRRERRSREQIVALLREFRESGMTVKEFSCIHQISPGTFHKWQSRFNERLTGQSAAPGFSELQVDWSAPGSLFAEVNGIKLYQRVEAVYLKSLLL
jgi:Transposase